VGGRCGTQGGMERCLQRFGWEGRREERQLRRPRRRWKDNVKLDLREIRIDGANWIWLDQDRGRWRAFMNTVMKFRVP
jgi:hypothetical protein